MRDVVAVEMYRVLTGLDSKGGSYCALRMDVTVVVTEDIDHVPDNAAVSSHSRLQLAASGGLGCHVDWSFFVDRCKNEPTCTGLLAETRLAS